MHSRPRYWRLGTRTCIVLYCIFETACRKVVIRSLALILLNNDHNFAESSEQYSHNGKISRFTTHYRLCKHWLAYRVSRAIPFLVLIKGSSAVLW